MAEEKCCEKEIEERKEKLNSLSAKNVSLKENYRTLLIENLRKDVIIRELEQALTSTKYSGFEKELSEECVKQLRMVGDSQKEDTNLISIALLQLHDGKTDILKMKTISGRSKSGQKNALSPEKKQILERLYDERLSYLTPTERSKREHNLGKLIRNALDTVSKKE